MSDYSMYHALGDQQPAASPYDPNRNPGQGPPGQRPPVAPSPAGYQQSGSAYATAPPSAAYGAYQQSPYQQQQQEPASYFPPQQSGVAPNDPSAGLAAQLGGMAIAGDGSGTVRKKKDRHAYHDISSGPGSSQAFNGMPPPGAAQAPQFLNQGSVTPQGGYGGQQITPAMNQFPAPVNPAFSAGTPDPTPVASSAQGRVDPESIPSIPRSRDVPAQYYLNHMFPTMENHVPPPAAVPFVALDQGNSSPKFARLTMTHIPSSAEALASIGLPLGLTLQPLAPLQEGESAIPVLDFGDSGPPRCRRCRAYINPFMTFKSGGNKYICNLCTFPNDTPMEYFAPTDPSGVRVDRQQRPELTLGTVDFLVPREYWTKEPVPMRWLFLIDVTEEAVNKGYLDGVCEGIMSALYSGQSKEVDENGEAKPTLPQGTKVGIVTFDKQMHFYNLSPRLDQAQMMVMPDIEDPFVPFHDGLFVDPEESKTCITQLLNQLPQMFNPNIHAGLKNPEPALLPAMEAAAAAMKETGGKIICSLAALPTWGRGRLFLRDDNSAVAGTDAEKKLLSTEHPGYIKLANMMVENGIGADFFLAAPSGGYLDLATIGHISAKTGGEVFHYPNFHSPRDSLRLSKEIKHSVKRETGFQALMKVRCSNGLQIAAYHGNFTQHTFASDLEFGAIDADKAIGVMFGYDGKLDPKLDAHFQSALLYTTAGGQRRVRCHNLVASVAETGGEAIKFVDQDAIVTIMAKEAASRIPERSLKDVRAAITEKTVDILAGYRKNFSSSHPTGQLVIPENLKEFSMYMLALVKCRGFKGGKEPTDRRVHDLRMIKSMGPMEMSLYLYPRIYSLHNLADGDGFANENGHLRMPSSIRASFSKIEEGGVYVVDNGQTCLLWLHQSVSPNLLEDLFGEQYNSLKSLDAFMNQIPVLETHLNAQVRNILAFLEGARGSKGLTIQLARQGLDGAEYEFARCLTEDRNNEAQSYVDWLVHLHRHIQLEVGRPKTKTMPSFGSRFQ
ncbi:M-phase inducer phosphatase [Venturia nashicola]|uniref:M-phase inducer phosphatase n=1 Tax=Venturia nashicola TaxID=86259 RepID=A0A4Z1P3L8_9PEZI|nr:M-phase inducer phosphatase [Venturia nashicola]TLD35050.1 M-phase inducer phosphatase [Venturia nashicola]